MLTAGVWKRHLPSIVKTPRNERWLTRRLTSFPHLQRAAITGSATRLMADVLEHCSICELDSCKVRGVRVSTESQEWSRQLKRVTAGVCVCVLGEGETDLVCKKNQSVRRQLLLNFLINAEICSCPL